MLLASFLYAFLAGHGLPRTFASAGIGPRSLTANRQTSSVPKTPVTVYIPQPGNILRYLSAKLTADNIITVDNLSYSAKLVFGKLAGLGAFFNLGLFQNPLRGMPAYTINVSQRNPD